MKPFERLDPAAAEWEKAYSVLHSASAGEIVYNEALEEALGRSLRDSAGLSPIYRAIDELEKIHQRSATRVRGVGFQIVEGWEHFTGRVKQRRRRSLRATQLANRSSKQVNRFALSADERKIVDETEETNARILDQQRAAERRTRAIEDVLEPLRRKKSGEAS